MPSKTQHVRVDFELPEGYVPEDYPNREGTFEALITGILSDFRIKVTHVEFLDDDAVRPQDAFYEQKYQELKKREANERDQAIATVAE